MIEDLKWQRLSKRRRDQRLVLRTPQDCTYSSRLYVLLKIVQVLVAILADQLLEYNARPCRTQHRKSFKAVLQPLM